MNEGMAGECKRGLWRASVKGVEAGKEEIADCGVGGCRMGLMRRKVSSAPSTPPLTKR